MATTAFEPLISAAWGKTNSWKLDEYKKRGGYKGLEKALEMAPAQIIETRLRQVRHVLRLEDDVDTASMLGHSGQATCMPLPASRRG